MIATCVEVYLVNATFAVSFETAVNAFSWVWQSIES